MTCRLGFLFLVIMTLANNARAELPSESELPGEAAQAAQVAAPTGEEQVADETTQQPASNLPPESELPRDTAVTPSEPADEPQTIEPPATDLPNEGALPPEADGAAAAPEPAGALPLAGSPDGIPWLRLNLRGHTAPIRAVEFMPDGKRFC